MKLYYALLFAGLLFGTIACKKTAATTETVFRGKVFALGCSTIGLDIEGAAGTGSGTTWTDASNTTHTNAVTVKNTCYVIDQKLATGDVITFKISTDNKAPGSSCILPLCLISNTLNSVYIYDTAKVN